MFNSVKRSFNSFFNASKHIAPLAVLRMAFGSIMLISAIRFVLKGWISAYYIKPRFHFTFYGFDWVKPLGETGMYALFAVLILAALFITIGLFYRAAIVTYFLCFTYVELIDKTTYLNHYYFISVMAFLMILVPANRYFSVDTIRQPTIAVTRIPAWTINIFKLQLVLVYFFAGVSKLNYDWLIAAMPLKIWLPANSQLPIIGGLLT
ncbi:MAG: deoxyribonuclease HsdR, partial [Mucilaginibacter sp.]|nr:deoxyribonuclease HsdR [Mucilaginibacter sp.]